MGVNERWPMKEPTDPSRNRWLPWVGALLFALVAWAFLGFAF
jgi:hypothetical protein